jgi:CheY-like chemotaxis protein
MMTDDFERTEEQSGSKRMSVCSELNTHQKLEHRRILLVEDDSDTQELLKTVLSGHGAELTVVGSSAEALTELHRAKPDVIISDIGMAGENGYDLIKKIRSLNADQGGRIPAIALTAYAAASDRRQALLAGFQTHLSKPVNAEDLIAVILSLTFQHERSSETDKHSSSARPSS